jgi:integrase
MPRSLPPYIEARRRKGKITWYVRRSRKQPRIKLQGKFGSDVFWASYRAALEGSSPPQIGLTAHKGTLRWLCDRWRESSNWRLTAKATQRQRDNILHGILEANGAKPFASIKPEHVLAGRERRQDTPFAANNYLKTLRALFAWAVETGLLAESPAAKVTFLPKRTKGHEPWTDADIDAFRRKWPLGTRARVAFETIYGTGLRRGDAVRFGKQHIGKDGLGRIIMEKTGKPAVFYVSPDLFEVWSNGPIGDLTFIVSERGMPSSKESFGNNFREWCRAAGVNKSAHGLRKNESSEMAEGGATEEELMTVHGWTSPAVARIYTRGADQTRLAKSAGLKRMKAKRIPPL